MIKKISLLIALLSLSNCQTPYQKSTRYNAAGGYSDEKLSDNSFKITFSANEHTSLDKTKDYALLRSAEVAMQNNFQYFKIENRDAKLASSKQHTYNEYSGFKSYTISKPIAVNTISCYVDEPKSRSFSERVGNLFLSISQKDGEGELFDNNVGLRTAWIKYSEDKFLNDADAIAAFNNLLGFIKKTKPSFNINEIHTDTNPRGRNAALGAVIKEFEENNIYPLHFRKSHKSSVYNAKTVSDEMKQKYKIISK